MPGQLTVVAGDHGRGVRALIASTASPIQPALFEIRENDIQTPIERLARGETTQNVGPAIVHAGRARAVIERQAARVRKAAESAPLAFVAGDEARHVRISSEHFIAAFTNEY